MNRDTICDGRIELWTGDCLEVLKCLREKSVHTCVTSPPYFALRSYLPKGRRQGQRKYK